MAGAGVIDQKQVVGAGPPLDVDVFSKFDRAFGTQHDQAAVAPGRQAVRGEPVHPHIAPGTLAAQHDFAKIFEAGRRQFGETAGRAADHFGVFRPGENQKLVDLVGADVAQDAAMRVRFEEPGRADRAVQAVRRQIDGLHDAADLTRLNQPQRRGHRGHLEALRKADREDAAGFRDDLLQSASCAKVVTPGLSDMTSLPFRIAVAARAARSRGMAPMTMTSMEGSSIRARRSATSRRSGEPFAEARQHAGCRTFPANSRHIRIPAAISSSVIS